jgi:hypothetical protein
MLFGLIVRSGTFAINAGLVFLLSQQAPQLDWWHAQPNASVFAHTRDDILAGLSRVRTDLETNGKLLFRDKSADAVLTPALESRAEDLDRRAPRTVPVMD